MCGITGFIDFSDESNWNKKHVLSSQKKLSHRGPDDSGLYDDDISVLGHTRLSILDLSKASHQPFTKENYSYTLTFNGEIYNYSELRSQLEQQGVEFTTNGDTEVLFHWLIAQGTDGIEKLNGFFAFAFYDEQEKTLLLARDRMGQKPLYFHQASGKLCFSSELKAILPYFEEIHPNHEALSFYLRLGYFPAPHTAISGVEQLKPGHWMKVSESGNDFQCYFKPEKQVFNSGIDFFGLLRSAVEMRMVSDRPLGTFLSGGIDSSLVTAFARQFDEKIKTFSIGFSSHKYIDESQKASRVSEYLGTEHHSIDFDSYNIEELAREFICHLDEPFADSSALAYYLLCQFTSNEITVSLSGDGADELFGGYRKHRALALLNKPAAGILKFLPELSGSRESAFSDKLRKLGKLAKSSRLSPELRYLELASFYHSDLNILCVSLETKLEELTRKDLDLRNLNDILIQDQSLVLEGDMLRKADRMSMAHSLEVRSPFMDHRVVNYANSLPANKKVSSTKGKIILRETFSNMLPEFIWNSPKRGFEIPLQSLLKNQLSQFVRSTLHERELVKVGIFNSIEVKSLLHQFDTAPNAENTFLVWAVLIAQNWFATNA